jgi:hypothetical protein
MIGSLQTEEERTLLEKLTWLLTTIVNGKLPLPAEKVISSTQGLTISKKDRKASQTSWPERDFGQLGAQDSSANDKGQTHGHIQRAQLCTVRSEEDGRAHCFDEQRLHCET